MDASAVCDCRFESAVSLFDISLGEKKEEKIYKYYI